MKSEAGSRNRSLQHDLQLNPACYFHCDKGCLSVHVYTAISSLMREADSCRSEVLM